MEQKQNPVFIYPCCLLPKTTTLHRSLSHLILSYWSIRGLGLKGLRGFSLRAVRSKPFLCSSYGRYYLLASCLLCSAAYVRNLPCLCYLCLFGLFWPFSFSPHISLPTTTILYFLVLFEFAFLLLLPLLCLHYNNASFFSFSSSSLASIRYLRLSTLCVVVDVLYLVLL